MENTNISFPAVVKKFFPADSHSLFSVFTQPEKMEKWLILDKNWETQIKNSLTIGGRFNIHMRTEYGLLSQNGGVYVEIDRPKRLVFTWAINGAVDSKVTINFREVDEGTEIIVTQDNLPNESFYYLQLWSWQRFLDNLEQHMNELIYEPELEEIQHRRIYK